MEEENQEVEISEEAFKDWLDSRLSPSTIRQYLSAFRGNITNLTTQEGINTIMKEKVFNRLNNPFYKGFLKSYIECFNLPFEIIKSRRKNQNLKKTDYKFLTKEEVNLIIKESGDWISILTRIYFDTGLRLRELIDVERKNISIEERTIKGIGKGNKPFKVKFGNVAGRHLEKWLDQTKLKHPFHLDSREIDWGKSFWYFLKKQCIALSIFGVHPHRFRHALGHHLRADKGFDLQQIKVKLRHSKLDTTEIYTTATQEEVDDKMDQEVYENGKN